MLEKGRNPTYHSALNQLELLPVLKSYPACRPLTVEFRYSRTSPQIWAYRIRFILLLKSKMTTLESPNVADLCARFSALEAEAQDPVVLPQSGRWCHTPTSKMRSSKGRFTNYVVQILQAEQKESNQISTKVEASRSDTSLRTEEPLSESEYSPCGLENKSKADSIASESIKEASLLSLIHI